MAQRAADFQPTGNNFLIAVVNHLQCLEAQQLCLDRRLWRQPRFHCMNHSVNGTGGKYMHRQIRKKFRQQNSTICIQRVVNKALLRVLFLEIANRNICNRTAGAASSGDSNQLMCFFTRSIPPCKAWTLPPRFSDKSFAISSTVPPPMAMMRRNCAGISRRIAFTISSEGSPAPYSSWKTV